jgi:hypothetical protein
MKALELVGNGPTNKRPARELDLAAGKGSQSKSILKGLNANNWEQIMPRPPQLGRSPPELGMPA